MSDKQSELKKTVIEGGYCIGCGACAMVKNSPFSIELNKIGQYQAVVNESDKVPEIATLEPQFVCPFSPESKNEDQLAEPLFKGNCSHDKNVGFYKSCFAGFVDEGTFRAKGSSGGFGTWVLHELFDNDLVDHIIHVKEKKCAKSGGSLFEYSISSDTNEIKCGSKSRYYPIEMSQVLNIVRNNPGRYAIVGLPCFIKSIRLLQGIDKCIKERIRYCIGLVCGHLKSSNYSASLAWQAGIAPEDITNVDFRIKSDKAANKYSTLLASKDKESIIPTTELFGTDWGIGAFKYKACDFCDDVFAETADLVLGDAWLPNYVGDEKGTNIVVVRNDVLHDLVINARTQGRLVLDDLSIKQVTASQDAGIRHRKGALGYRLEMEKNKGNWIPTKRVLVGASTISSSEKARQLLRTQLRQTSHDSFQEALLTNDINKYLDAMNPLYNKYKDIKGNYIERSGKFIKRVKSYLIRKLA
ncbi:Coenzyme F420 hydrogenase/dehydrogenase, beta subunit C-terminal domain [Vibrio breoganii]|uniref:Coenzyme F420 hydrogenase/dehydrogenase, beta subunit C-terminal domain n=1 Tax=Vibrio breoganii TaxID=553239 RepID=UPI000C82FFE9|nr:Coenzyme F420 hydrogenase/dehydrogenase, beta subunit C-terminal domain [Vibrio breoganii]